jgi:hypothetical protein
MAIEFDLKRRDIADAGHFLGRPGQAIPVADHTK